MMEDKIYAIIKDWVGVSTWYTGHPLDQQRFTQAMRRLVAELGATIDIDDFEKALRRHASSNPVVLGQPSHWNEIIDTFCAKAEAIFEHEQ